MSVTPVQFDVGALRRAIHDHDAEAVAGFYDDAAEVVLVDKMTPPSSPRHLHGRQEIADHWRDVFSRDMTHDLQSEVVGTDRAAYSLACRYADGTRVLCMTTLELRDGKVVHETGIQAWDD